MIDRLIIAVADAYGWFLRKNLFPLFHVHIVPSWDIGKTWVRIIKHETLVEEKREEFEQLRGKYTGVKYFEKVLGRRDGVKFLIFEVPGANEFVQFEFDGNEIILDFPMHKESPYFGQKKEIVNLLKRYRFMKVKEKNKLQPLCWNLQKVGYEVIRANFGGNTRLAGEFAVKLFKQIFKTSPDNFRLRVL